MSQEQNKKLLVIMQAVAITFLVFALFTRFTKGKQQIKKASTTASTVKENVYRFPVKGLEKTGAFIRVDTPLYTAKISKVNGAVVSFYVKKYKAELVSDAAERLKLFPLTTVSSNETVNRWLLSEPLEASASSISLSKSPEKLVLKGALPDGRVFVKEFTFHPDNYVIDVKESLKGTKLSVIIGPDIKINEAHTSRMGHIGPVVELSNGKVERIDVKKITSASFNSVKWAGEEDKYFLCAVRDSAFSVDIVASKGKSIVNSHVASFKAFFGPKELSQLEKLGMDKAIDFGIFGFLAKPLLKFFLFLHQFIPNYGLVIIVLTLIIKIIMHPLTHKSFESMKKMQVLAPKMEELKKKYAKDPKKLNEEMMKLYKEEGVNPMGGCLPMILQIPIFFALYEIFLNAVELKGASFLWIKDLSTPDPTFVLPILMGLSMILQQKLTPSANPEQQKIFYVMAIVFTFMFAKFPAGLVLYWMTNNLITAAQNFIINKMIHHGES
ncbi:membrane protein insertase YidC [Desulfurobacterium sp.]|uniref:membrane protein insertase YidC n=1 Tax=Desulfurobacterium sp. TaxID=2004706 RepID=UPI00263A116C|nr:membrane protein insertase YidC [Desulfurobacterium sp.]